MLLIDKNTFPTNTVYFIAATIYGYLSQKDGLDYTELYNSITQEVLKRKLNVDIYLLGIDSLFLLNKLKIDQKGKLHVY